VQRLLRAFLELAREARPGAEVAARAKVRDPAPVLERLAFKDHVRLFPNDPDYFQITFGERAREESERPWWRFRR
jgi:hypothetical protein